MWIKSHLVPRPSQALVHVSNVMSSGRYHQLRGIVSSEVTDQAHYRDLYQKETWVLSSSSRTSLILHRTLMDHSSYGLLCVGPFRSLPKTLCCKNNPVWWIIYSSNIIYYCVSFSVFLLWLCVFFLQMVEHIEQSCRSLTEAQRQQLAVNVEDIIFLIPEDVSVVYDQYGEFCLTGLYTLKNALSDLLWESQSEYNVKMSSSSTG